MTNKIEYTATFSNGQTITRKSEREYGAAFLWIGADANGTVHTRKGFAKTREMAAKELEAQSGWIARQGKRSFAEVVAVSRPGPELLGQLFPFGKGE